MQDALYPTAGHYACFNDFFARELHPDARPIVQKNDSIASPVDGLVTQFGAIHGQTLLQAKQHTYSVQALLAGSEIEARAFDDGQFITTYLAPYHYHRVHMPYPGHLLGMRYVPGRLFSVNARNVQHVSRLFARNERIILQFETAMGPMAVILVGALIVGSMSVPWHGIVKSVSSRLTDWDYRGDTMRFVRGDELGRFLMGSTVIVLFGGGRASAIIWEKELMAGASVRFGQQIAGLLH